MLHSVRRLQLKRKRMHKKRLLIVCCSSFVLVFLAWQFKQLYNKYGSLFYIQTFLPDPNLPYQLREPTNSSSYHVHRHLRILCLVVTSPQYHEVRAVHVAATWGRHCSKIVFLTSEEDSRLAESVIVPEAPGYNDLWSKVAKGFDWSYSVLSEYDWVLKADDDSFVLIENLQKLLKVYNTSLPLATGLHLRTWDDNSVYFNGGAGYVLSRAAVKLLVNDGLRRKTCEKSLNLGVKEDVNMARCLAHLGVTFLDLRDFSGRRVFHIYSPQKEIDPRQQFRWAHLWLKKIPVASYKFGMLELSDQPISFHHIDGETMYLLYYLVYYVNPN